MLQGKLSELFGFAFKPYDLNQVHGTIIGLEGDISDSVIVSRWYKEEGHHRAIDSNRLLTFIRSDRIKDFEFKMGGWQYHDHECGIKSRGQHPFIRSFSIQGEKAVAMGWPFRNGRYSEDLYELRKSFEEINFLHKWNKDDYKDNDFFFVLGSVSRAHLKQSVIHRAECEIRTILAGIDERVRVGKDTMSIVAYVDTQLPLATSNAFGIEDSALTPELIHHLYKQCIFTNSV